MPVTTGVDVDVVVSRLEVVVDRDVVELLGTGVNVEVRMEVVLMRVVDEDVVKEDVADVRMVVNGV